MYGRINTLNELIEALQELAETEVDTPDGTVEAGELPVRIAYQQNWPLAGRISATTVCKCDGKMGVWLAETPVGRYEHPYGPRNAWEGGVEGLDFGDDEEY